MVKTGGGTSAASSEVGDDLLEVVLCEFTHHQRHHHAAVDVQGRMVPLVAPVTSDGGIVGGVQRVAVLLFAADERPLLIELGLFDA